MKSLAHFFLAIANSVMDNGDMAKSGKLLGAALMEAENMKDCNDSNFGNEVGPDSGFVLVDFWAEWCGPCRALAPVVESVSRDYADRVGVVKVNVDQAPDTAAKFGIRSIPTLILFRDGQVVGQNVGAGSRTNVCHWLDNLLAR